MRKPVPPSRTVDLTLADGLSFAANCGPHPAELSDIQRRSEKGNSGGENELDLRAILNEPKLVTYTTRFIGQFRSCDAVQRDEVEQVQGHEMASRSGRQRA